jgi:hypothetical protein
VSVAKGGAPENERSFIDMVLEGPNVKPNEQEAVKAAQICDDMAQKCGLLGVGETMPPAAWAIWDWLRRLWGACIT